MRGFIIFIILFISGTSQAQYHTSPGILHQSAGCSTPAAISGQLFVSKDGNSQLSDATAGGTWSSSTTTIATIGSAGLVSGIAAGTATITYSTGVGCEAYATVTVAALTLAGTQAAQWDFSIQSSITLGTGVAIVADRSGNSRSLLQPTVACQPAYVNDGGKSYIITDGVTTSAGDFLQASFPLVQSYTIMRVLKMHWAAGQTIDGGITANSGQTWMNSILGFPYIGMVAAAALQPNTNTFPDNAWSVLTTTFNTSSSQIIVDTGTAVTGNPGTAAPNGYTLGRDGNVSGTNSNIEVKFVVIFTGVLTSAQQKANYVALINYKP